MAFLLSLALDAAGLPLGSSQPHSCKPTLDEGARVLRAIGLGSGKLLALLTIEMALVAAGFALIGGGAASWIIGQWQSSGIDLGSIVELIGSSPFPTVVYAGASWTMTAM